jgi:hypothetical protein
MVFIASGNAALSMQALVIMAGWEHQAGQHAITCGPFSAGC